MFYVLLRFVLQGVSPSDILCLTFTNKAANEMKERLKTLLPNGGHEYLTVSAPIPYAEVMLTS